MNKFDLGTVLKSGWELFLKDPALLILATILAFVLSLTIVLAPLAMAGMTLLVLKLARGERPQIGEFFEPFADFVRYFLGGLVVLAGGLVSWLAWWASPGLGFVAAVTEVVDYDSMKSAILDTVPPGTEELNLKAYNSGYDEGVKSLEHWRKQATG